MTPAPPDTDALLAEAAGPREGSREGLASRPSRSAWLNPRSLAIRPLPRIECPHRADTREDANHVHERHPARPPLRRRGPPPARHVVLAPALRRRPGRPGPPRHRG